MVEGQLLSGRGAAEMGSASAVLDGMTVAATSLDLFDFGFIVFFGRQMVSVVPTLACAIDVVERAGSMKLSAR